ncbi:MAG TPA: BPTI/Kunitz domain-containing protein [Polyangiaceae bacterium]|nr:BPTI/Kunitz domain-containing protein [Polyangiaceae bacterium]
MVLAGCVASLALGCGGKSNSEFFEDGGSGGTSGDGTGSGGTASNGAGGTSPTGGSNGNGSGTGETNGSSTTSTGGTATTGSETTGSGTTGGGTTGSGTTGSGGGPSDERCLLPLQSGNCDAYFEAYGYNVETGHCEQFIYGGCGGNANRFESLAECQAVCDPDRTHCESTVECVIDHGCCGFCGVDNADELVAVNSKHASFTAPECALVDCAQCSPPAELGHFGARCNDGTCEVYDVRTSDLSACKTDADCRLRAGLSCCESCGEANWVAISTDHAQLEKELCGDMPAACPPCAPIVPDDLEAICGADGHCVVSTLD